jgi:hypothetical protein
MFVAGCASGEAAISTASVPLLARDSVSAPQTPFGLKAEGARRGSGGRGARRLPTDDDTVNATAHGKPGSGLIYHDGDRAPVSNG